MMRTLAQTGNGWMTFKDPSNARCNQTSDVTAAGETPRVVHLSNLCTEILEVTSDAETAVCNLGSINLGHFVVRDPDDNTTAFDFDRLGEVVRARRCATSTASSTSTSTRPTQAESSNARWRPVGLGVMGLQDVFFRMRLPFDSPDGPRAVDADRRGDLLPRPVGVDRARRGARRRTRPSPTPAPPQGELQFDLWGVTPSDPARWERPAGAHRRARPAQLAADRHRPDGHDRLDRRRLRVHRAAGVQPVQARDAVGRVPADQHLPRARPAGAAACGPSEISDAIKRAEGSVQDIDAIPADAARRSTARRGSCRCGRSSTWPPTAAPFIDQSQSLNLFMESPTIGKLSSMYLHAWKAGLKTTYYLRSRPATRIDQDDACRARATAPRHAAHRWRPASPPRLRGVTIAVDADRARRAPDAERARQRRRRRRLLAGEPRLVRGVHVMSSAYALDDGPDDFDHGDSPVGGAGSGRRARPSGDPRPRARPHAAPDALPASSTSGTATAIRNTWTVEEIDFSDDLVDLHRTLLPAETPPDPPAGRVLRHRRLDRRQQPRAQPVQAHQRPRGPAVPVAASSTRRRCTCSST